jgi:hypothetical protein
VSLDKKQVNKCQYRINDHDHSHNIDHFGIVHERPQQKDQVSKVDDRIEIIEDQVTFIMDGVPPGHHFYRNGHEDIYNKRIQIPWRVFLKFSQQRYNKADDNNKYMHRYTR